MADERTKVLLDVEVQASQPLQNIQALKKAVSELNEEQKALKKAGMENSEVYLANEQKIKALNSAIGENTRLIQADVKGATNLKGSYNDLSAQLTKLKQAYHAAGTDEDRERILKNLTAVDARLKELDEMQGVYTRNVGNYPSAFAKVGKAITMLKTPLASLKMMLNSLAAHPIIAIVGAIVVVLTKIVGAIKSNAAAMETLKVSFSAFSAVGTMVNKVIDGLAKGLGWLGDKITALVKKMGLWTKSMEDAQTISKEEIEIQKEARKVAREVAENEQKIADLRAKAAEKDKRSATERLNLLQQASDLEEANAKKAYDLAKRKYDLQVLINKQSNSSQDDLDKENDLYIAMIQTQTALANKQRELASQMAEARKKIAEESAAAAKAAAEEMERQIAALNEMDKAERERLATLAKIRAEEDAEEAEYAENIAKRERILRKYHLTALSAFQEEMLAFMESEDYKVLTAEERERVIAQIKEKYSKEAADKEKAAAEEAYKHATETAAKSVQYAQQVSGIIGSVFDVISERENEDMERYKEQNDNKKEILKSRLDSGVISQEQYESEVQSLNDATEKKQKELQLKQAKRQKAMAIMNATLNAAAAIIAALAASPIAIGVVPNPAGIASLALATATGAAQVAAAAATPLPKAGRGMMIEGADHAHGGVLINAEGGEAIINKRATARFLPLLSSINQSTGGVALYGNGGMVGDSLLRDSGAVIDYDRLASACANIKTYVAVTDINDGQARFAKVEQLRNF